MIFINMERLVIIIAMFLSVFSHGQYTNYNTSGNGDWSTNSTWDTGTVPANDPMDAWDLIAIRDSISLTGDLTVVANSVLFIDTGDTLAVSGNVEFKNNSIVLINGVLIIGGNLTNKNNSDNITVDGVINVTGDVTAGNGSDITGNGTLTAGGAIDISGSGLIFNTDQDCDNCSINDGIITDNDTDLLPIELLTFDCEVEDNVVRVIWVTATELNNEYFLIYHSIDGIDWGIIAKVYGAGSSSNIREYNIIHSTPTNSNFYKLTQFDFDGQSEEFNSVYCGINYEDKVIDNVQYINLMGQPVQQLTNGIFVKKTIYTDGSVDIQKISIQNN